ncbi:MAG: ferredoxin--NADP reductase [Cyclobacteriaceae bacterium]
MAFGLFKKKKKRTDERYQKLVIKSALKVAEDAVELIFDAPNGLEYTPGQFITIIDQVNGEKLRRAYSLCSVAELDENPAVIVKRVPEGRMSNYINDEYAAGREVEVMEPMGLFSLLPTKTEGRHVVFFGGGSGITPLYSMIRALLNQDPNAKVDLVFGNREEKFIIFKDEIQQLSSTHENFRVLHLLENDPGKLAFHEGRPNADLIVSICEHLQADAQSEFYLCGPTPMMDVVTDGLQKFGINDSNIIKESFEAPVEEEKGDMSKVTELSISLDGDDYSLTISRNEPILAQALKADIDMPYSCQSGLCTACRGKVTSGSVSIDHAEGLTAEEIDEGYVLTCVGKSLTDTVKIEMG